MSNNVYMMNSKELPTEFTHYFTVSKFIKGFENIGFNIKEAKNSDDITDNSIVILSNHGLSKPNYMIHLKYLADNYPNCIYICWYFHNIYNDIPFKKFILTGEHFHAKPKLSSHITCWNLQQNIDNYHPFTFGANVKESDIGLLNRDEKYNACFIGSTYKYNWITGLDNIIYLGSNTWTAEKPINEQLRIQYFLNSKICLGFHSDANIHNNVVTERVYEGLAYGCVVISDNPIASELTDGIVQIARNKEQFKELYFNLLNDDCKRKELQQKGYEWVKKNGLYSIIAESFIKKINNLYKNI